MHIERVLGGVDGAAGIRYWNRITSRHEPIIQHHHGIGEGECASTIEESRWGQRLTSEVPCVSLQFNFSCHRHPRRASGCCIDEVTT
ncbi:MAG TPA: hypothetical protein EYN40_01530 [Planctomycetes bacterium]|nr:hypothetical protein [Planctomycetota bacterium]